MELVQKIRNAQRADGPATILAIGTANPPNEMLQAEYPDFYFRVTKSEHMTDLKHKFKRMCMFMSLSLLLIISYSNFFLFCLPYIEVAK